MKLTWFGGTTIRIHIGGAILVVDAAGAPAAIDAAELVSGADRVIDDFGSSLEFVDGMEWKSRSVPRLIDEAPMPDTVEAWRIGAGTILIDAVGEAPLVLMMQAAPPLGRWAERAVIALFGAGELMSNLGRGVLQQRVPRLLALAGGEAAVEVTIDALRDQLDGAGLVALEAGLALEV